MNWLKPCKTVHSDTHELPWWKKRKMREWKILSNFFSKNPSSEKRNKMMEKIIQIHHRILKIDASSSSSRFGGATPFKVQINFDIPIFKGQIDAYVVDRLLSLLEGCFQSIVSLIGKILLFHSLRLPAMSRSSGKFTVRKGLRNPLCLQLYPLGTLSEILSRNNITLLGAMNTSTHNRPH